MVDPLAVILHVLRAAGLPVHADLPDDAERPALRVEESGGVSSLETSRMPDWLRSQDFQLDAWDVTRLGAATLIDQARSVLLAAPRTDPVTPHGVLTLTSASARLYLADSDWPVDGRPGPRYQLTVRTHVHPGG